MKSENTCHRAHCLVLPYPLQGHINPLLQFAKRLQHKGVEVILVTTRFIFRNTLQQLPGSVNIDTISDGYDEGGRASADSVEEYLARLEVIGLKTLAEVVEKFQNTECPVNCIVYDPFMPWALEVAKELGLVGAAFFTQSLAVDYIYYHVCGEKLKLPITEDEFLVPGLPPLGFCDLPSFVSDTRPSYTYVNLLLNQFGNLQKADWVLCNSFHKLEEEVEDWMANVLPLRTIGPTLPSMYLDKRLKDDKDYGLSMFKPNKSDCANWLDEKPDGSIIYLSLGSMAQLGASQMKEIAMGLENSNFHFLWVVRSTEQSKLPPNFMKSEKGLIVSWCSQLEVLPHKSIECFMTHCGWNSTLEALSLGVPMVAVPHWSDQPTNAKYVSDIWRVGVRTKRDGKDQLVTRESMERKGERNEEKSFNMEGVGGASC